MQEIKTEEERFSETLARGLERFEELAGEPAVSAEDAFMLAATYGFPIELTVELAEERGQPVDVDGYRQLMDEHREISRGAAVEAVRAIEGAARTEFVGYEKTDVLTAIAALEPDGPAVSARSSTSRRSTRRVADRSRTSASSSTRRRGPGRARGSGARGGRPDAPLPRGRLRGGDRVRAVVPWSHRFPTMANHTATHLLHKALQEALGDHVRQAGSAVRPDKLRFDFTHGQALTADERGRSSAA